MCRHLAYLGPPRSLAELVLDPPHSLLRQSWAPRDSRGGGALNADGFGVGWFPTPDGPPVRHRTTSPLWSDVGFAELAAVTRSGAVLASVRSATVGMPVVATACAPFTDDGWLFAHNGAVRGWPDSVARLAEQLPVTELLTIEAPMDSALLWLLLRRELRKGTEPGDALASLVLTVAAEAPGARLNLLLTNGEVVVATTWTHSLSVLAGRGSVAVSSEPWDDDPAWRAVPDQHLVVADRSGVELHPLAPRWGGPIPTGTR
ncbi:ergothioneine biosynthesis protein EgtC [Streptoalloteichus hindustanus]|uniref:Gamma-glutamyl-hercynylcysteine sulfoxide hydrolase n=1 Tax=Streptoalloteichus hindustanus TaxID=2017 RepID=A0A1M5LRB4_STRHI|nr:ergothioneine biosynthesis protein EgtC [Streptoalloteichus hindustanus]SHG67664.1 glutamine amidotransferase [Streptoalloteichus hindustanus]